MSIFDNIDPDLIRVGLPPRVGSIPQSTWRTFYQGVPVVTQKSTPKPKKLTKDQQIASLKEESDRYFKRMNELQVELSSTRMQLGSANSERSHLRKVNKKLLKSLPRYR